MISNWHKYWVQAFGALVIICCSSLLHAQAPAGQQPRLTFWSVRTGPETEPDQVLVKLLKLGTEFEIQQEQPQHYETIIHTLVEATQNSNNYYLARVPPYVFVAAEMLGANIEPLATYKSVATDDVVYHSWFVVRKQDLIDDQIISRDSEPTLENLVSFIRKRSENRNPVKFIYHDKFSTSSYFLPSLFFLRNDIFAIKRDAYGGAFASIYSEKPNDIEHSSELPARVVAGDGSGKSILAAVYDGTKMKVENQLGNDLAFIPLPTKLPNDLLVCSKWLDGGIKKRIQVAIKTRKLIDVAELMRIRQSRLGDFKEWKSIDEAEDADKSLAELRHLAQVHPSDVTVEVTASDPRSATSLEAVKNAIRLSQTEFKLHDPSFHGGTIPDYTWTIQSTHDGALSLSSQIHGFHVAPQEFVISFTDPEDLTKRVCQLIQSRLHRIRYIWPYEDETPTVIRDVDFNLDKGSVIEARRITWVDPVRDAFEPYNAFPVTVQASDFHRLRLDPSQFPLTNYRKLDFDPMSNETYQVLLIRPSEERLVFTVLTYGFLVLLGVAALVAVYDYRRRLRAEVPPSIVDDQLFKRNYQSILERYYGRWRNGEIAHANVLWCDRAPLEAFIEGLTAKGLNPSFNRIRKIIRRLSLFGKIPLVKDFLGVSVEKAVEDELIHDPSKLDDPARLSDVVPFLINKGLLSSFTGTQLEWDVLDTIASQVFQRFHAIPLATGNGHGRFISYENATLETLVSKHFDEVINESIPKASFFNQTWNVTERNGNGNGNGNGRQRVFEHKENITYKTGSDSSVSQMILRFRLPQEVDLGQLIDGKLNAWLLGKIHRRPYRENDGVKSLCIEFKPIALLQE